ncbi:fibrinogen alpha chain [Scleropages formosus]|uniref:fibrinogen alpha chain n=1 Tax=Scleropages formosus TaxID=113540 RepID=UPI000878FE8A|nr:fibrinogen alpha chain [Scleropages formosus]
MGLQRSLCLLLLLVSSAQLEPSPTVGPRGNRPVEHGYKSETCAKEKQWPFCSDEDWGPKCPSGCRIQGLLDKADQQLTIKIDRIRKFLEDNRKHYKNTDQFAKQTYDYIREKLVSDTGNDNKYMSLADQLRQRIITMKVKIDRQLRLLEALKKRVQDQVKEMQRLEVDIDIKLRACKGSCADYSEYSVDKDSYVTLEKQLNSLDEMKLQNVETISSLKVMKSRPMKDVLVSNIFKSAGPDREAQKQEFFPNVQQVKLFLESEGSSPSTPATISKTSGTAEQLGSDASSKSTTRVTTHTVKCTKTIIKQVSHTKDGPVEKVEVVKGGPECESMGIDEATLLSNAKAGKEISGGSYTVKGTSMTSGDFSSLFPDMRHPQPDSGKSITQLSRGDGPPGEAALLDSDFFREFSSSSSSSKTITSGSSKTSHSITSKTFAGDDLGGFAHSDVDDDLPDIQARSFKSTTKRKKRDYIGKDCVDILQNHASGHKSNLFKIKPEGMEEVVEVYCDQDTVLGGWVLVQQRMDGSVNFNRTWEDYKEGFGSVDQQGKGELWLGNKHLNSLTQADSVLRVELEDWEGQAFYAEYTVRVGPESEGYTLTVSAYSGNAGDALIAGQPNLGAFLSHASMKFSTFDKDHDRWEENCAEMYGGGWWYNNCQSANLNGIYYKGGPYDPSSNVPYEIENGIVWLTLKPADYSLKAVSMKIRPLDSM